MHGDDKSTEDSPEDFCSPVLQSSLKMHRIIRCMGSGEAETVPQPRVEAAETPAEKFTWWMAEIFWRFCPPSCRGWQRRGELGGHIGEKERPFDVVRQQAEDRLEQTIGLSHWGPAAGVIEGSIHQDQWNVPLEEAEEPDSA
jgi:hypothetical protein